ncbi:uncharacterized protein LOC115963507 [Quercus lobata]|uniref:uncharacterized protein LOC115963507 n=1 Tax=Quercus lobata TaxID=97700 RepID=UPI001248B4C9|nr:uncharacterized protein LOC115963507 [Quercus lobata]
MSTLEADEILFAYIAMAPHVVSLVLIRVDNGRVAKWGTIPEVFYIKHMPRTSVKGQVLVDLVVEFVEPSLEEEARTQDMDEKLVGVISLVDILEKAEPLANIRDVDVKKFIWKNIVTRFGVPHSLISDNGFQFDSKAFRRYCCELGITNRYSISAYPQGNGQAKAINKVIVNGFKKRSTEETPFSMTYGAEAVIPLEMGFPTLKTSSFCASSNNELLEKNLDLIEERKERAMVQLAYYQYKFK